MNHRANQTQAEKINYIDDFTKRVHKQFVDDIESKIKEFFKVKFGRDFRVDDDVYLVSKKATSDGDVYLFDNVEFAFIGLSEFIATESGVKQKFEAKQL